VIIMKLLLYNDKYYMYRKKSMKKTEIGRFPLYWIQQVYNSQIFSQFIRYKGSLISAKWVNLNRHHSGWTQTCKWMNWARSYRKCTNLIILCSEKICGSYLKDTGGKKLNRWRTLCWLFNPFILQICSLSLKK
jgi:hypothetical protein